MCVKKAENLVRARGKLSVEKFAFKKMYVVKKIKSQSILALAKGCTSSQAINLWGNMTGSSLKLCVRWLNFIQDSWILWKTGHGLTSEQCRWFVWFLKHWKMLYFGNQGERNKHTATELGWIGKFFFHMNLWDIYYLYFSYKHSPLARNTVVLFSFLMARK